MGCLWAEGIAVLPCEPYGKSEGVNHKVRDDALPEPVGYFHSQSLLQESEGIILIGVVALLFVRAVGCLRDRSTSVPWCTEGGKSYPSVGENRCGNDFTVFPDSLDTLLRL